MRNKKAATELATILIMIAIVIGIVVSAGIAWRSNQEKTTAAQAQVTDTQVSQALAGTLRVIASSNNNSHINLTFKNVGSVSIRADTTDGSKFQVVTAEGDSVICFGNFSHSAAPPGDIFDISLPCSSIPTNVNKNTKILLTIKSGATRITGFLNYLIS